MSEPISDYVGWMRAVMSAIDRHHGRASDCAICYGSGVEAMMCCSGHDCGCRGMPVDFERCPCHAEMTDELERLMGEPL